MTYKPASPPANAASASSGPNAATSSPQRHANRAYHRADRQGVSTRASSWLIQICKPLAARNAQLLRSADSHSRAAPSHVNALMTAPTA